MSGLRPIAEQPVVASSPVLRSCCLWRGPSLLPMHRLLKTDTGTSNIGLRAANLCCDLILVDPEQSLTQQSRQNNSSIVCRDCQIVLRLSTGRPQTANGSQRVDETSVRAKVYMFPETLETHSGEFRIRLRSVAKVRNGLSASGGYCMMKTRAETESV